MYKVRFVISIILFVVLFVVIFNVIMDFFNDVNAESQDYTKVFRQLDIGDKYDDVCDLFENKGYLATDLEINGRNVKQIAFKNTTHTIMIEFINDRLKTVELSDLNGVIQTKN